MNRIDEIARNSFAPELVQSMLESLIEPGVCPIEDFNACPDSFLADLGKLLTISPPMLDTIRSHPEYLCWLKDQACRSGETQYGLCEYQERWEKWSIETESQADGFERLRIFKRREYLLLSFLDIAGRLSFEETVRAISDLADWIITTTLRFCWDTLVEEESARRSSAPPRDGFVVIAMGKLGGRELNYSSDVDLIFCRRNPENDKEQVLFSKLGERLVRVLSKIGPEGFLYRVDMRLRPHGTSGLLVPTIDSLINYYESWSEPWERQALIKARTIAGSDKIAKRFSDFAASFAFSRQLTEAALEDVKRVKHIAEREYDVEPKIHLKQGPGGIRDIEFYVQYSQLMMGWRYPEIRTGNTLNAIEALADMKVLLDGEQSTLALAYLFLRTVEHRLQLNALTPQAILPEDSAAIGLLAQSLGFEGETEEAAGAFLKALNGYRSEVRAILERVYLAPGFVILKEREEELAQLLSDRMPRQRVHELLSQYGFHDIDKAWQNIRLLALGPAGRLLPPGERRTFLEFAFPMLEVLRDTIDPDQALHNLEDFATATGNRISFLRTLASRRPHLARLTNLLALSNRCRQILSRHPEYFDSLARGIHLHEGRPEDEMYAELQDRMGLSPRGESLDKLIRRYRQREMVRIAYRDLAGLADSLEISRELSYLASACLHAALNWTRPDHIDLSQDPKERIHLIALGKLGSRQMHYASDLDLVFLYDAVPTGESPEVRATVQREQDARVEKILELLSAVTPEGVAYSIDLRLRPGGSSSLLARTWDSVLNYSDQHMQPWERMAMVRSRPLGHSLQHRDRWDSFLSKIVYDFSWNEEALDSIRHIKKRIEREISKETRSQIDFKYGKGGIADLEFLVQFLQIKHGRHHPAVRAPELNKAVVALCEAEIVKEDEKNTLIQAHQFERLVENRYQLMEEWTSREVTRESPTLSRLAASIGYKGDESAVRKAFVSDWDATAAAVRHMVEKYFYV